MRNERITQKFIDILGEIDEKHITEAAEYSVTRRQRLTRFTAVAAAIAVLIGGAIILMQNPTVPTYDDAYLSAEEIGELFGAENDSYGATNAYTKVYAPSGDMLDIGALPTERYATVWKYKQQKNRVNKSEFTKFLSDVLPRFCAVLGEKIPEYEIHENSHSGAISVLVNSSEQFSNLSAYYSASIREVLIFSSASSSYKIKINGEELAASESMTNAEILTSLSDVKSALFEVFGVEFDSVKLERGYSGYGDAGAQTVEIVYYNSSDYPEKGDHIRLLFESEDGDGALYCSSLRYTDYRYELSDVYEALAECRILTLDEAEALLEAGYVFGGHVCELCMAEQAKIDFSDYDYVGFEYKLGGTDNGSLCVPFYAFYKDIGQAENGNRIYAKTLVPAVEVEGLDEYFDMQKENHGIGFGIETVE